MNFSQEEIQEIILLLKKLDLRMDELKTMLMNVSGECFGQLHREQPLHDSRWDIYMRRYEKNRENLMKIEEQIREVTATKGDRTFRATMALCRSLGTIDAYVSLFKNFCFDTQKINKAEHWLFGESRSQPDLDLFFEVFFILVEYINKNA